MIKNIIFDMGNVLIYFKPELFLDKAGVTDSEERRILMRNVYQSVEWAQLDRGVIDEPEAAELIKRNVPESLHSKVDSLVTDWNRPLIPVPGMADLVRELKEAGYGIYLLSNASRRQHDYWPDIPGYDYFDGEMVSAFELVIKPEPEIYDRFLKKFSLSGDECVFIDDSCVNAEAAMHSGISSIVFHDDINELREKLTQLGVLS